MNIPILDLSDEYKIFKKEISEELKSCFQTQSWILGPKELAFEKEVAKYLGVKYAVGVASGTDALILSLKALAVKLKGKDHFDKKDEIVTTPFTFIATAEAIVRSGASPVFVDIDYDTFNIDPKKIKQAINKNTVGIMPVHLYGLSAAMVEIKKIARENKLFIVEDAAQAFGGSCNDKKLGTIGDCGCYSFFPSKNLGAFGDGGLIATNNGKIADNIKILRNHGQRTAYDADFIGYNSRLDSMQAAILLVKLKYVDKFNNLRRKVAANYNKVFKSVKSMQCPSEPKGMKHVYNLYTIKVSSKRNKLLTYLNNSGIGARVYYPVILPEMKAFRRCRIAGSLNNCKAVLNEILTLPVFPMMKQPAVTCVARKVCDFYT
ncbi:MAG: DegT/DnrJ/EryC1/StrS family aminotransferase [Candidatus Omnitrophica bacterium]|nr:DegT/DnrJ/EryC1/StrS family aminotransferase [Candidatus Omnitrophota bacterium]